MIIYNLPEIIKEIERLKKICIVPHHNNEARNVRMRIKKLELQKFYLEREAEVDSSSSDTPSSDDERECP